MHNKPIKIAEAIMSEAVLNNKLITPDEKLLAKTIGTNLEYWKNILKHVNNEYENITEEWKFYGKKYGWQLKTFLKKRNLFFCIPYEGCFKVVFIFGDKAVTEIEQSDIASELISELVHAKKYLEGRGIAINVENDKYLSDIKKLIDIKINN